MQRHMFSEAERDKILPTIFQNKTKHTVYIQHTYPQFAARQDSIKYVLQQSYAVYSFLSLFLVCDEVLCYVIVFHREGREVNFTGQVSDWDNTGFHATCDTVCKYGLKCGKKALKHRVHNAKNGELQCRLKVKADSFKLSKSISILQDFKFFDYKLPHFSNVWSYSFFSVTVISLRIISGV